MQNVDIVTRTAVRALEAVQMRLIIDGVVQDAAILEIAHTSAVGGTGAFSVGNACSASAEIRLAEPLPDVIGRTAVVDWCLEGVEDYPLIVGTITDAPTQGGTQTITVRDAMFAAFGTTYTPAPALQISCTAGEALQEIADAMGVALDATTYAMADLFDLPRGVGALYGVSLAAAAGQIAAVLGGNALISRAGALTVKLFQVTDETAQMFSDADELSAEPFSVSGVQFHTLDNLGGDVFSSAGVAPFLRVENDIGDDALAMHALAMLPGQAFRAGEIRIFGGLLVEPGDLITVVTADGPRVVCANQIRMEWDGGCLAEITSAGADALSQGGTGSLTAEIRRLGNRTFEIASSVDGLRIRAEAQQESVDYLRQTVTEIRQTAEAVAIRVGKIEDDGVTQLNTETGVTVDTDGLHIRQSTSQMENSLDAEGMLIMRGEDVILQADARGVDALDIHVRRYLDIGDHTRLEAYTDSRGAVGGLFII